MIPRILHMVWLGTGALRDVERASLDRAIDFHPSWRFCYHQDASVFDHPNLSSRKPALLAAYEKFKLGDLKHPGEALLADLIRLAALVAVGGVALDHDIFLLRPLDALLAEREQDRILCRYPLLAKFRQSGGAGVSYAGEQCAGGEPGESFWLNVLDRFCEAPAGVVNGRKVSIVTANIEGHRQGRPAYDASVFCPHARDEPQYRYRVTPATYGIHAWRNIEYRLDVLESLCPKSMAFST